MTRIAVIIISLPLVPVLAFIAACTMFIGVMFHCYRVVWEKA